MAMKMYDKWIWFCINVIELHFQTEMHCDIGAVVVASALN